MHKSSIVALAIAAAAVAILAGCETEPSEQIGVSITPNNVNMRVGESQSFTASGWQNYTWTLSDTSIGVLSNTKGDTTIYTAVSASTNGSLQTLTVAVDLGTETTTSGTNNTPAETFSVSGTALITQNP